MPLDYHEPREKLSAETQNNHRAVESLIEELEAVMWYQQRAEVSEDAELKAVLEHNRDEEMEHAAMLLEYIRRNLPGFEEKLQEHTFQDKSLQEMVAEESRLEEAAEAMEEGEAPSTGGSLNIGPLK